MSLSECIPGMVERGELTPARARIMQARYNKLVEFYSEQMGEAAARAEASYKTIEQLEAEAAQRKRQTLLQVAAQQSAVANMTKFEGAKAGKWRSAALALFDRDWQGRAPYSNVTERHRSILGQAHARMNDILNKHSRGFLSGAVRAKAELIDLAKEAFGEGSGNAAAKALAGAWTDTAEWLRQRFNAAGGDIGKLENWGFPQHHDSRAVRQVADDMPEYRALERQLAEARKAGNAAEEQRIGDAMVSTASKAWRDTITPLLDRSRMIDRETGQPFTERALQDALDEVFRTIRTDGWEGRTLGAGGGAKMANRYGDARFLHFKDSTAWLEYHQQFGTGTVFDTMIHHIEQMSRDIAHLEILGPNPTATVRWLSDFVEQKRALMPDSKSPGERAAGAVLSIERMYQTTSGQVSVPVNREFSKAAGSVRSVLTAAQLGSASISAITDVGWQIMARLHRGMPITSMALDLARQFGKGERVESVRTGLIAEEASRLLSGQNRYTNNEIIGRKAAWLAERVLNLSLLSPWTQAGKWSFGRGMESTLARFADRPLEQVPNRFQRMLREYGLGNADWEKIRATPIDRDGFMSPLDIADAHLRDRVLGMILSETDAAIPSATARARAIGNFGMQPGSLGGELVRSIGQYKSFGVSLLLQQGGRIMSIKGRGERLAYFAGVNAVLGSLGLLVVWLRDLRSGDEPREITPQAMGQAWLQGVGFGPFGDFLNAVTSERSGSLAETVAGPTVGAISDFGGFTVGNAGETILWAAKPKIGHDGSPKSWNEQTHMGREAVNLAKRYTPGTNLWYARLAAERMMFDKMQMLFDPDYAESWRAIERKHAQEGHPTWWHHGDNLPDFAKGEQPVQ